MREWAGHKQAAHFSIEPHSGFLWYLIASTINNFVRLLCVDGKQLIIWQRLFGPAPLSLILNLANFEFCQFLIQLSQLGRRRIKRKWFFLGSGTVECWRNVGVWGNQREREQFGRRSGMKWLDGKTPGWKKRNDLKLKSGPCFLERISFWTLENDV